MGFCITRAVLCAAIVTIGLSSIVGQCEADEIVIDENVDSKVSIGDFDCSRCPTLVSNRLNLFSNQSTEGLTAGRLWEFFDAQGISKLESITICLDVEPTENRGFELQSLALTIEDPNRLGQLITNVSFGENSIVVPDYEISFHKPEARLEISFGYDFMEQFSAESTEKIQFDFSSDGNTAFNPAFTIEGESGLFSGGANLFALAGFVGFWSVVFVLLNRFTQETAPAV